MPRSVVKDIPLVSNERQYCYKNFKELSARISKLVLRDWSVSLSEDQVRLCKYEVPFVIPRLDIQIDISLGFTLIIFGWYLPVDHILYKSCKRSLRNITVSNLINEIETFEICTGHPENLFSGLSIRHVYPIHANPFEQMEESSPFPSKEYTRAEKCEVLVLTGEGSCVICKQTVKIQEDSNKRKRRREEKPAKLKAPISLTSSHRIKLTLQAQRLKCRQLEGQIQEMKIEIEQKSLPITQDLSHDLLSIISENSNKMTPFIKLFWEQQQKNVPRSPTGRRYHPTIIRWCLSVASKSASAYDELRDTFKDCTIVLPSRRVLRDYTNAITPRTGFNPGIINEIRNATKGYVNHQRFVFILFDEMKVQGNLIWDKHSGELIGYTSLGDPYTDYATLEKVDEIASHALLFMVRGISSPLKHTIGYFSTTGVTGVQLFPIFWRAVSMLEITCGLAVVGATGDGASQNRKFFLMHESIQGNDGKNVVYCTKNLFAPERNIYFFSDAPHLLKTARNCLFNSGSGNQKRLMWNNGQNLLWNHVSKMFYTDIEDGLHLLPRITTDHIELTAYSVMKVSLAAQVLSSTMANVLKNFGPPDAAGTADFCEQMDRFFDCFNVRSTSEGERVRKSFLLPYKDCNDDRFSWLTDVFLNYLSKWKESIKERPGNFDDNAKARMFLSHQTYEGIQISIYSMIDLVKFLLNAGMKYVLTNHFCQDPVEQYFGKQRSIGRRSDNPTIYNFGYNDNKIRIQRSNSQIKGNTIGNTAGQKRWRTVDANKLLRRKRRK